MRPHHEDDRQLDEQARPALGVAPRSAGAAIARERAAAYQGFTAALPHAAAARRVLEEGGRQLGLRAGVVRTLGALLTLYRGWGLRRPPVLTASNAAIARLAACDERTVQKHLATLREQGLILVEYGPYNRRRPDEEARPDDLTGIDLRPADRRRPRAAGQACPARQAAPGRDPEPAPGPARPPPGPRCPGRQPRAGSIGLGDAGDAPAARSAACAGSSCTPPPAQPSSGPSRP